METSFSSSKEPLLVKNDSVVKKIGELANKLCIMHGSLQLCQLIISKYNFVHNKEMRYYFNKDYNIVLFEIICKDDMHCIPELANKFAPNIPIVYLHHGHCNACTDIFNNIRLLLMREHSIEHRYAGDFLMRGE